MKKLFLISLLSIFVYTGCGSTSLMEKPEYKPADRNSENVVKLWNSSEQYFMTTILQDYGNVEVSIGNNGTITPESYMANKIDSGIGLSLVLEIVNKGSNNFGVDLGLVKFVDAAGKTWKLHYVRHIKDNNRMDSSINFKSFESTTEQKELSTNSSVEEYSADQLLSIKPGETEDYFLVFSSDYKSLSELPENLVLTIHTIADGTKFNSKFKFDKIAW